MDILINNLKKFYDSSARYLSYLESEGLLESKEDISPFWQALLKENKRRNYPTFNEILTMRQGFTYGLADAESNIDQSNEYQHACAAYLDVSTTVPLSYFEECPESAIGSPICFDFKGNMISRGFIANALTSYQIIKWCQIKGLTKKPLRILEIGAGYGNAAYQLVKKLKVKEYVICDLPENLFLSSYYLQANFPDKKVLFITNNKSTVKQSSDFKFLIPAFLEKITDKFDLVVNSYSFQEMNLKSVKEYFNYIKNHITDQGIFYSLNSHGKSGVMKPSDYPIEQFKLLNFKAIRQAPWEQVFSTTPYEIIMSKTDDPRENPEFMIQFDALAKVLQLGLQKELANLCNKFVNSKLSNKETEWLSLLNQFFQSGDYSTKIHLLNNMRKLKIFPYVISYISGSLEFSYGNIGKSKALLEKVIVTLPNSQAKLRSFMMLANISYMNRKLEKRDYYFKKALNISPYLKTDICRLTKNYNNLSALIAHTIYLDISKPLSFKHIKIVGYSKALHFFNFICSFVQNNNRFIAS